MNFFQKRAAKRRILASGLFDPVFYLQNYPDVAEAGLDPLEHFLKNGGRESRSPSRKFDGPHYVLSNPEAADADNILLDWLSEGKKGRRVPPVPLIDPALPAPRQTSVNGKTQKYNEPKEVKTDGSGERDKRSIYDLVSAHFDRDFYIAKYPDVANSAVDPITHYLHSGEREGRSPNRSFNPRDYLQINPDVASIGTSPFVHYLLHGRDEGRVTMLSASRPAVRFRPKAPPMLEFAKLAVDRKRNGKRKLHPSGIVDVIVPVYRGFDDTLACIHSLLIDGAQTPREIIVINDCSPEPALAERLRVLAELNLFTLLENVENLGFVATVNRGMMLHPDRDVVLLNSDTEVYNDWLDRIVAHGQRERIASVTPLSNNATICSYPKFGVDNPVPFETSYGRLDNLAANCNRGKSVKIPTGVGFCMFIQRQALNTIGLFNTKDFAKGYGEENDFCMRAANAGWSNLLALDVFVRHTGETSFADSASQSQKKGMEAVNRLHPDYLETVGRFMRQDPARPYRRKLDLERLKLAVPASERILCFSHKWGGGIQRYLSDRAVTEQKADKGLILCQPEIMADGSLHLQLNAPQTLLVDNLDFSARKLDRSIELIESVKALNVTKMEIHSLVGWPLEAISRIPAFAKKLGIQYEFMLHDYTPVCPQINLTDSSDMYCGELGLSQCNACVAAKKDPSLLIHPRAFGTAVNTASAIDVVAWRQKYRKLLVGASQVVAPSADTAARFERYFPDLQVTVVPHQEVFPDVVRAVATPYSGKGNIRIAIIGAIGPHKGANVLFSLAHEAKRLELPIEYVVIGYTCDDARFKSIGNVEITGPYTDASVFEIIKQSKCHVALLPSVWPETHCYTLSIAAAAKIPTIVFDIGAQGLRARSLDRVKAVPLDLARRPHDLISAILEWAAQHRPKVH